MPTRYYTFAPGKAPAGRKGDQIALKPGQALHFAAGKGYYAGPPVAAAAPRNAASRGWAPGGNYGYNTGGPLVVDQGGRRVTSNPPWGVSTATPTRGGGGGRGGGKPTPPPPDPFAGLTNAQIQARAEAIARGQLLPEQEEIRRQQEIAARTAREQELGIQGFAQAAAGMEGGMAPAISAAYSTATGDVGALGQGMATGIQQDVAAQQAQDQATAAAQGIQTQDTTNAPALHDTVFGLTGLVPGESLAARGAAAAAQAAGVPQIQLNAGRQDLESAMADAVQKNDDYAQQLIKLAAQFPGLKAQALQTLNQYELDKAEYREKIREYNRTQALQERAEAASEATAGGMTAYQKGSLDLQQQRINKQFQVQMAGLRFKNQQAADKATSAGKTIDVPASKLLGYVRYKDGTVDKSIKVAKDLGAGQSSAGKTRAAAIKAMNAAVAGASKDAFDFASTLRGDPVRAPKPTNKFAPKPKGIYKAAPWAKGPYVFKDGTTNKQNLAARTGRAAGWHDVERQLWGKIGGDQLMAQYNMSEQQVWTLIHKAMTNAGWKKKYST